MLIDGIAAVDKNDHKMFIQDIVSWNDEGVLLSVTEGRALLS